MSQLSAVVRTQIDSQRPLPFTRHAWRRMCSRALSPSAVEAALTYGREAHVRGAAIFAIGRAEVVQYQRLGINLSAYEGVQVVCSPEGVVLTVYRNSNFRGLRPRRKRRSRRTRTAVLCRA